MTKVAASSLGLDFKSCFNDFIEHLYSEIASIQHVKFNNTNNLFKSWFSQQQRWFLNKYSEEKLPSAISKLLDDVDSSIVVFQVGPSFLSQYNTTASEDGWFEMLDSFGLRIIDTESFEVELVYTDKRYDLIATHWRNINACHDNNSIAKPKFLAAKISYKKQDRVALSRLSDKGKYGLNGFFKRGSQCSFFYIIHFFQDLAFLRGLVVRIGYENLHVIINDDNLTFHHLIIVNKFIKNHAIKNSFLRDFDVNIMNAGSILLTSTLGPLSPMHLSCSRLIVKARELHVVTITLQHGITLPDVFTTMTEYTLAWSEPAANEIIERAHSVIRSKVFPAGNVRPVYKVEAKFLTKKFGCWVSKFAHRVMIATNFHWAGAHSVSVKDVNDFITNLSMKNPDTLFFIRPHPEDYSLRVAAGLLNVILIDDVITGLLDTSIDQILVNCDLLLSTYSTLLYDAARNNIPFVAFNYNEVIGKDSILYPELTRIERIDNIMDVDLELFLKNASFIKSNVSYTSSFSYFFIRCLKDGGSPITNEQQCELDKITDYYLRIAPDYGRNAYKNKLESAFIKGVS